MDSSHNIHQAVILAAGFGTRLRPLTDTIPKAMIPLAGKPLLLHHIEQLKKHGVVDIYINLHYLPNVITDYFGDGSKFGVHITYALEAPDILGTAGGVKNFENKLQDNFFVIYGDVFSLVDYTKMAHEFLTKEEPIAMGIIGETNHPMDSDLVEIHDNGQFIKIHAKPHAVLPENYYSMQALFIFNKEIFSTIPVNQYYEIDHHVLPNLLEKGVKIYAYRTADYLKDIGTPERYAAAEEYLERQKNTGNYE
jgi:NDP-sugar pyrophosphorylase family protein